MLFSDQLDFAFAFDKASGREFICNLRRRPNEAHIYSPRIQDGLPVNLLAQENGHPRPCPVLVILPGIAASSQLSHAR